MCEAGLLPAEAQRTQRNPFKVFSPRPLRLRGEITRVGGPNDALNGWNDDFSDAFYFQSGGGTYRRFDMRVNTDYDPRLNGDFDRRVDIDYDRRTTLHIDPRVNY